MPTNNLNNNVVSSSKPVVGMGGDLESTHDNFSKSLTFKESSSYKSGSSRSKDAKYSPHSSAGSASLSSNQGVDDVSCAGLDVTSFAKYVRCIQKG